mgnify:FL=1
MHLLGDSDGRCRDTVPNPTWNHPQQVVRRRQRGAGTAEMSAHEEQLTRAFRKTDESKQSLIVGFTICLGFIRSFPVYPAPLRTNQYRSQRLRRRSYGEHKERLLPAGGNSRSARSYAQIREPPARVFRSKPLLEVVPCPAYHPLWARPVTSVITVQSIWEILSLKYRTDLSPV